MFRVKCDDCVRSSQECCGHYMPIIRIGNTGDTVHQSLRDAYFSFRKRPPHRMNPSFPLKPAPMQVIIQRVTQLMQNLFDPNRQIYSGFFCESEQGVAQRHRNQHASIQDRGAPHCPALESSDAWSYNPSAYSARARSSNVFRRDKSRFALYARTSRAYMRRCVPTMWNASSPFSNNRTRNCLDIPRILLASIVVNSCLLCRMVTALPALSSAINRSRKE